MGDIANDVDSDVLVGSEEKKLVRLSDIAEIRRAYKEIPAKYYYSHVATKTDDHAHNIFIVNEAARTKISTKTTQGVKWGQNVWHKVRLERDAKEGTIKVYYDDMTTPIMIATDKTFPNGYIGFGSFDDSGMIRSVRILTRDAE